MKRIVICCDGTWNWRATEAGVPRPTNVGKLAAAVQAAADPGQALYRDPGARLSTSLREAYRFLVAHYERGDEIFLFGASRGALTVRRLAGLVHNFGVLRRGDEGRLTEALALYRGRLQATPFRRKFAVADATPIRFIGVWDTVGALHDSELGSTVERAYHALAIDEKRRSFSPTLWTQQPHAAGQVLEQTWFAGTHSDVAGSHAETGLSDVALLWMAERAEAAGLRLATLRAMPDPQAEMHESQTGAYRLLPPFSRPMGALGPRPTHEAIHPSVLERCLKLPDYRPQNLADFFLRHPDQRPMKA